MGLMMQRGNIIVVCNQSNGQPIQCWGNFKRACKENKLPYHSLKMKDFPIVYENFVIRKIRFNEL